MKLGSLFSGGGLGDFGFMAAGMEITWQCEIDEYCQKILQLRYPESKKYRDIKTLKGSELETVDIITGGFPCQPFSVAGKQKGKEDNRYLWPEMLRVIKECRPRWIVGENVPGIINLALDTVCADLETEGYEVWPIVFPSHALGAWHKRDRLWIICHAKHNGQSSAKNTGSLETGSRIYEMRKEQASESERSDNELAFMANASSQRCETRANNTREDGQEIGRPKSYISSIERIWQAWWETEPDLDRVVYGASDFIHRLKMLGNGQVPACTYVIGKMIMDIEKGLV